MYFCHVLTISHSIRMISVRNQSGWSAFPYCLVTLPESVVPAIKSEGSKLYPNIASIPKQMLAEMSISVVVTDDIRWHPLWPIPISTSRTLLTPITTI